MDEKLILSFSQIYSNKLQNCIISQTPFTYITVYSFCDTQSQYEDVKGFIKYCHHHSFFL